jgi:hypothetical protein
LYARSKRLTQTLADKLHLANFGTVLFSKFVAVQILQSACCTVMELGADFMLRRLVSATEY